MANILEQAGVSPEVIRRNVVAPAVRRREAFAENLLLVPIIADVLASPYNHNRKDPAVSDALFPQFQDSRRVYWRKDHRGRIETSEQLYRAGLTDFGRAYFSVCNEVYLSLVENREMAFSWEELAGPDGSLSASWIPALILPLALTAESVEESREAALGFVGEVFGADKAASDVGKGAADAADLLFRASALPDASPAERVEELRKVMSEKALALPEPYASLVPGVLNVPLESSALLIKKVISAYCVENADSRDDVMPGVAGAFCGALSAFLTGQFSPRMVQQFADGEFISKEDLHSLSYLEKMERVPLKRSVEQGVPERVSAPGVEREVYHVISLQGAEPVYVLGGSSPAADEVFRKAVSELAAKNGRHPQFVPSMAAAMDLVEKSRVYVNHLGRPLDGKAFFSFPEPEIRTVFFDTLSNTLSSPITAVTTAEQKRAAKKSGLTVPTEEEKLLNFSKFSSGCAELMRYWLEYLKKEHHFVYPKDAGELLLRLPTGICLSYKDTDRSIVVSDGAKRSVFGFDDLGVARVLTSGEQTGYNYENVGAAMERRKAYDATVPLLPHDVSLESFVEVIKNLIDDGGQIPDDERRDKIRAGDVDAKDMMDYEYSVSNYERTRQGLISYENESDSVPLELEAAFPAGFVPASGDTKRKVIKVYEPGERLADTVMARSYAGTLFTAGAGVGNEAQFAALMKRFGIQRVVWLSPYSPSRSMKNYLTNMGVTLNEWGDLLNSSYDVYGAKPVVRPTDAVYNDEGFREDLGAIRERVEQGYRVCVVDTPQHPFSNRAFQLMARFFPHQEDAIPVGFIFGDGSFQDSRDIESRMVREYGVGKDYFTVEMAYKTLSDLQAGRHKKGDVKIYLEDFAEVMTYPKDCVTRDVVHRKGDVVYDYVGGEAVPRVYKEDVLSKSGAVLHAKGSNVVYSRDYFANVSHKAGEVIKDSSGEPVVIKHKAGEVMKDASGKALVWETDSPNEVHKASRERRYKRKR